MKASYHSVTSCRIIKDALTGKSRQFGFINLKNYDEYQELLNYKGNINFEGNTLIIK